MHRRAIANTMSVPCPWHGASAISVRPAVKDRRRVSGSADREQNRLPRRLETSTRLRLDGADGRTAVAWSSGLALPGVTIPDGISDDSGDIHQADRESAQRHAWRGGGPRFGDPVQVPRSAPRFRYPVQTAPVQPGQSGFPRAREGAIGVVFRQEPVNDHPH
jgi:hypothetical protein